MRTSLHKALWGRYFPHSWPLTHSFYQSDSEGGDSDTLSLLGLGNPHLFLVCKNSIVINLSNILLNQVPRIFLKDFLSP